MRLWDEDEHRDEEVSTWTFDLADAGFTSIVFIVLMAFNTQLVTNGASSNMFHKHHGLFWPDILPALVYRLP
jgi:hypothetical protein